MPRRTSPGSPSEVRLYQRIWATDGRRAVYAFGFCCLGITYALYPYATSLTELAIIRIFYSLGIAGVTGMLATVIADYTVAEHRGRMVGLTGADIGTTHFAGLCYERPRLRTLARQGLFYLPDRGLLPRCLPFGALIRSIEKCHGAHSSRDQVLNQLRVGEFLRRDSGELSGGEQRRCEWALALLSQPRCIVSDEPLAGTMPRDQELLIDVLRDEARRGTAIILTGHEVERLSAIGDEFVWMSAGSTHVLGSWEDATAHPGFRREYLGEY